MLQLFAPSKYIRMNINTVVCRSASELSSAEARNGCKALRQELSLHLAA